MIASPDTTFKIFDYVHVRPPQFSPAGMSFYGRIGRIEEKYASGPRGGVKRSYFNAGGGFLFNDFKVFTGNVSLLESAPGRLKDGLIWEPYLERSTERFLTWLPEGTVLKIGNIGHAFTKQDENLLMSVRGTTTVEKFLADTKWPNSSQPLIHILFAPYKDTLVPAPEALYPEDID